MKKKQEALFDVLDIDRRNLANLISGWTGRSPEEIALDTLTKGLERKADEILDELEEDGLLEDLMEPNENDATERQGQHPKFNNCGL